MCPKQISNEIYTGTAGGSLSGILAAISFGDLAQTIILAVVGTVVSFFVSVCLNRLIARKKQRGIGEEGESLKD